MSKQAKKSSRKPDVNPATFVFDKENYKWLFIGLGIICLGFILMVGKENILDFRKITLAPIVVLSGFGIVMYAILKNPKGEQNTEA